MFGRRRRRPAIETLDRLALDELLRDFEDAYAAEFDERITSAEFYDRYKAGAVDHIPDAIRWVSYYELFRSQGQQALAASSAAVDRLPVVAI